MSFITRSLSGITLPISTYGVHLVNKTVPEENEELEKKNVDSAIDILEKLWQPLKVNNIPIEICTFALHPF